jgi:hypothetical protein
VGAGTHWIHCRGAGPTAQGGCGLRSGRHGRELPCAVNQRVSEMIRYSNMVRVVNYKDSSMVRGRHLYINHAWYRVVILQN